MRETPVGISNPLGLRMVLMDGTCVDPGGPMGEGPGLDLPGVICGAEGQPGS